MRRYSRELTVGGVLGVTLLFLGIAAPSFYQIQPLLSLLAREAPTLVVTAGMALVILSRQIDISVGSQFAVSGTCAGFLAGAGLPMVVVAPLSIFLGACLGGINGILVAGLRLPSIVVTLATTVTWREALRWRQQGALVNLPDGFQWFGLQQQPGQLTVIGLAVGIGIALAAGMRYVAAGRYVYAAGSDSEAARLAGLRPRWITFWVFVWVGALTGLGAILNAVQSPQVDPKSGTGMEMKAIAAAVVGGVAISGGQGTVLGAVTGMLVLACIPPALTHLHVEPYWEKAIQGAIVLLAVVADGWKRRKKTR
jgi:rhamnose transport system permease protein